MRRLLAVLAAAALAPVLSLSAPVLASSAAPAAQAKPAIVNTCDLTSTWCLLVNQQLAWIGGSAHNTYLITVVDDGTNYHWFPRPGGTWGEIKNLVNNECWNRVDAADIATDGCDSSFHNTNELWYLKTINNGNQIVIENYTQGLGWYVWGDNCCGTHVEFSGSIDNNTSWAVRNPNGL